MYGIFFESKKKLGCAYKVFIYFVFTFAFSNFMWHILSCVAIPYLTRTPGDESIVNMFITIKAIYVFVLDMYCIGMIMFMTDNENFDTNHWRALGFSYGYITLGDIKHNLKPFAAMCVVYCMPTLMTTFPQLIVLLVNVSQERYSHNKYVYAHVSCQL